MSVAQASRLGAALGAALGQVVSTVRTNEPERKFGMKITSPKGFFHGSRHYNEGEVVRVDEDAARHLFAVGVAVAVNPTEFHPLLSAPKVQEPGMPVVDTPWIRVKIRREGFWHNRTYTKGDFVRVPEPAACGWIHTGVAQLADGEALSDRGQEYLKNLKKGMQRFQY